MSYRIYAVFIGEEIVAESTFASLIGAASVWKEDPTQRTVYEIIPALNKRLRFIPETVLWKVLSRLERSESRFDFEPGKG